MPHHHPRPLTISMSPGRPRRLAAALDVSAVALVRAEAEWLVRSHRDVIATDGISAPGFWPFHIRARRDFAAR